MSVSTHRGLPGPWSTKSIVATVIVFVVTMGACSQQAQDDRAPTPVLSAPPQTSYPMPPLKPDPQMGWLTKDGQRARLADYQGKILVLDFYATWCLPCRESIPRLDALARRHATQGLVVVGLNVGGADDRIKVSAFAQELHITYPLGFPDKALIDLFLSDDQTIPQTFVFGRKGELVKRFIGYDGATGTELERVIGELAKTK